jgi:hypothetical protein
LQSIALLRHFYFSIITQEALTRHPPLAKLPTDNIRALMRSSTTGLLVSPVSLLLLHSSLSTGNNVGTEGRSVPGREDERYRTVEECPSLPMAYGDGS